MNSKTISQIDKKWSEFARIMKGDPTGKSQAVIEKRIQGKTLSNGDLYRLNIVGSGIVFGQVLSGGF